MAGALRRPSGSRLGVAAVPSVEAKGEETGPRAGCSAGSGGGVGAGDSDFHRTMRPDQDANRIIGNFADFSTVCVQNEKIILHISGQNLNLF